MRQIFCLFTVVALMAGAPAAAQNLPPACPANPSPGRAFHLPPWRLTVLADSAFLAMRVASQDFDTLSARFRLQVQPSGAVDVLCVHAAPGSGASLLIGAARRLRFQREYDRPFRDTATVDVTLAVSRPMRGEPVHSVERRVTVGDGVRVELAQLPIERSAVQFSRAEQAAIYRAAIESIRLDELEAQGVRCVVFTHGDGPYEVAAQLNRPGHPVVNARACPPTRFAGAVAADYSTVPAGWVDPLRFELGPMDAWTPDTAAFNLLTVRSNHARWYACVVAREAAGWRAQCRAERSSVS